MDLTVENKGKRDENVALKLTSVPKGWRASLKGGSFTVTGVSVPDGKTRALAFSAEPEKGLAPGTYDFEIQGVTADGNLTTNYTITVTTRERSRMGTEDIQVTTSYPVLRGQTDATFEFSLDVANKSENDRTFNLAAQAPDKWEASFKPGYESKQISSLRIRGGSSQTVAVSVTPHRDATAGEYPVLVRISAGDSKADVPLRVVLTGIYKLDAATPSGILSADAVTGQAHHGLPGGQEHRVGDQSQHQPERVQTRELEGRVQAREDRGAGAGGHQAGGRRHHAGGHLPGGGLLGGTLGGWRARQQQDGGDARDGEGPHHLGLDRGRSDRLGNRRDGRPVRLAGPTLIHGDSATGQLGNQETRIPGLPGCRIAKLPALRGGVHNGHRNRDARSQQALWEPDGC